MSSNNSFFLKIRDYYNNPLVLFGSVLCFLILAIVCFVIYTFKKLIDFKVMIFVGLPASVVAGVACLLSLNIHSNVLRIIFACFIILIGVIMFVMNLLQKSKNKYLKLKEKK